MDLQTRLRGEFSDQPFSAYGIMHVCRANFLPGSDRVILDTHPYIAFNGAANTQPLTNYAKIPCNGWASGINGSQSAFGITIVGEFSSAVNDCGLWVRGVGGQVAYGGDCSVWEDASAWDQATKDGLKQFVLSSMDAFQNYFYWTWKVHTTKLVGRHILTAYLDWQLLGHEHRARPVMEL